MQQARCTARLQHDAPGSLLGGAVCRPCAQRGKNRLPDNRPMTVALHAERLEELKRQATMANAFGVQCDLMVRACSSTLAWH